MRHYPYISRVAADHKSLLLTPTTIVIIPSQSHQEETGHNLHLKAIYDSCDHEVPIGQDMLSKKPVPALYLCGIIQNGHGGRICMTS